MVHSPSIPSLRQFLEDELATRRFGGTIAPCLKPGLVIYLRGDLGAGKTTLTRGLLEGLGVRGPVKSPTYSLVEIYPFADFELYHFDLYRFNDPFEWEEAGFRECFHAKSVCVVEWPEKGEGFIPSPDMTINLSIAQQGRMVEITCCHEGLDACLKKKLNNLS